MKKSIVIIASIFLTACGGGDTSDGGGQNAGAANPPPAPPPAAPPPAAPPQAVTYTGTGNISLTAPGFPAINDSAAITVVVQGNTVTLTVDGTSVSAPLNNGAFSLTVPISENSGGVSCTGNATLSGTVSGNTVSGNINGNGTCVGSGINTPVTLTGSFTAQAGGP